MSSGFPKLPNEHKASSMFEWLFEVKATELGINAEEKQAKGAMEFRAFWSREIAPKLWEMIGCLQRGESPWDSMSDMFHLWAA